MTTSTQTILWLPVRKFKQQWRYVIPLVLLVMILMRLVWLQLRSYNLDGSYRGLVSVYYETKDTMGGCIPEQQQGGGALLSEFQLMKDLQAKPKYQRVASPGFQVLTRLLCSHGQLVLRDFLRLNQWVFLISIFFATCFVRLLTRSWILAMATTTVLLSRGHLIANIGEISYDGVLMMLVTAWMAVLVHYFRSGARATLVFLSLIVIVGSMFDLVFVILPLSLCVVLVLGFVLRRYLLQPVIARFRSEKKRIQTIIETGGIRLYEGGVINGAVATILQWLVNRPKVPDESTRDIWQVEAKMRFLGSLTQPFALWVYQNRRWLKLLAVAFGTIVTAGLVGMVVMRHVYDIGGWRHVASAELWTWARDWLAGLLYPLDLHYAVCLTIIILCAVQSPALGLPNVFEATWVLIFAILFMATASLVLDLMDLTILNSIESSVGRWSILAWTRSTKVFVWFEPTVLSFGLAGFYQLITVGEQSSLRRKNAKTDVAG